MAISLDLGSKRRQNVELNLVPFIDFLSCLLAFLMMTAVWADMSAMEYDPTLGGEPPLPDLSASLPPPPLTVNLSQAGYKVIRTLEDIKNLPVISDDPDLSRLDQILEQQRRIWPTESMAVLYTQDGVHYGETMAVLDHLRRYGYTDNALAGGPSPE